MDLFCTMVLFQGHSTPNWKPSFSFWTIQLANLIKKVQNIKSNGTIINVKIWIIDLRSQAKRFIIRYRFLFIYSDLKLSVKVIPNCSRGEITQSIRASLRQVKHIMNLEILQLSLSDKSEGINVVITSTADALTDKQRAEMEHCPLLQFSYE